MAYSRAVSRWKPPASRDILSGAGKARRANHAYYIIFSIFPKGQEFPFIMHLFTFTGRNVAYSIKRKGYI